MLNPIRRHRRAASRPIFDLEPIEKRVLLTGSISGAVFNDYNSNGLQDGSEPGLPGWTVYIDSNNNNLPDAVEQQRVTDALGQYEFANLAAPSQYIVREVLQGGFVQTLPGSGGVILDGSQAPTGDPNAGRPFTSSEIVVAFDGQQGLPALRRATNANASLRKLVDVTRSQNMFSVNGLTLVEVKLPARVDPKNVVARFESLPGVRWAQPNYLYDDIDPREFTPNDPQYASQFHHPLMQNNLAWDTTLGSSVIKIGVTDDGVLLNHPDLAPNIWVNPGEIPGNGVDDEGNGKIDDVNGWDVWSNDNNPNPDSTSFDHGTHVAGIYSARTNNGIGVAGTSGGSTIIPIRFYAGSGWTSTHVANAYRYAGDVAAHIVNTSYTVDQFANDNIFISGLQYMYDHGVLHINSAGNQGTTNPARQKFDQTLFVVNTQSNDVRNPGSNIGWGMDISAPGTNILSTAIGTSFAPTYELKTGTSMAAPNAAGVAALIWSAHPTWTREQVAAQLIGTADNINAQNPGIIGLFGSGRTNSFRGVTEQLAPPKMRALTGLPAESSFVLSQPISFLLDAASVFDPAIVNLSRFEIRGDGLDGVFNTGDDVLIPLTLTFTTGTPTYMIGTNRMNFGVAGAMLPDRYRFSALPTLIDPFGQALDGNGDGTGGDAFTRTFTLLAASNQYIVNLPDGQTITANFGNHDIAPPKSLNSQFAFATSQQLVVQFNEDVSASLSITDLVLENLTAGGNVDTSGFTLSYDSLTNTATFNVNGILPDADFRARLVAAGIQDLSGNTLDGNGNGVGGDDHTFEFFFMQADANRDRRVNLLDFDIIAANFGQLGTTFGQGNFNYDNITNLADFDILAARFGNVLAGDGLNSSPLNFGSSSRIADDIFDSDSEELI